MDNELDELLDSALSGFEKNKNESSVIAESEVTVERTCLNVENLSENATPTAPQVPPKSPALIDDNDFKVFDEIFNDAKTKESFKQFTNAFNMFGGGGVGSMPNMGTNGEEPDPTKLFEEFEKMMSQLSNEFSDDDDDEEFDFKQVKSVNKEKKSEASPISNASTKEPDSINKILEQMNKQSENILKNDDLFDTMGAFGGEDAGLMQPLISMLFSKDILHPSLKMMLDNYNKYLSENKDKENTDEYKNCLKQKEYIIEMCNIYENSKESDSQEVKSKQMQDIMELLEKCGHPPKELVPDVNPFENTGDLMKNSCQMS